MLGKKKAANLKEVQTSCVMIIKFQTYLVWN